MAARATVINPDTMKMIPGPKRTSFIRGIREGSLARGLTKKQWIWNISIIRRTRVVALNRQALFGLPLWGLEITSNPVSQQPFSRFVKKDTEKSTTESFIRKM
jgi:hypothetical protein